MNRRIQLLLEAATIIWILNLAARVRSRHRREQEVQVSDLYMRIPRDRKVSSKLNGGSGGTLWACERRGVRAPSRGVLAAGTLLGTRVLVVEGVRFRLLFFCCGSSRLPLCISSGLLLCIFWYPECDRLRDFAESRFLKLLWCPHKTKKTGSEDSDFAHFDSKFLHNSIWKVFKRSCSNWTDSRDRFPNVSTDHKTFRIAFAPSL